MHWRIPLALLLIGAVFLPALPGCSDHRSKWVGEWEGQIAGLPDTEDPVIGNTLRKVELTINSDYTYSLRWGPLPVSGNISFGNDTATLTPLRIADQPIEAQPKEIQEFHQGVQLKMVKEGEITLTDTKGNRGAVNLTRKDPT